MCKILRVETAIDGSFWRCKNGSPPGHCLPETMFTLRPAISFWATTGTIASNTKTLIRIERRGVGMIMLSPFLTDTWGKIRCLLFNRRNVCGTRGGFHIAGRSATELPKDGKSFCDGMLQVSIRNLEFFQVTEVAENAGK